MCGGGTNQQSPPVVGLLTSEVHLDDTHAVIDNANPATAPADVHDSVFLTVSGLDVWSGTVTLFFYEGGECGNVDDAIDDVAIPVNQGTGMPLENLLPQPGLAAGDYSYLEFFFSDTKGLEDVVGPCEPFKVVDPTTTTTPGTPGTTPSDGDLPTTGGSLTAVIVTGVALVGVGAALIFLRRRRTITEGPVE